MEGLRPTAGASGPDGPVPRAGEGRGEARGGKPLSPRPGCAVAVTGRPGCPPPRLSALPHRAVTLPASSPPPPPAGRGALFAEGSRQCASIRSPAPLGVPLRPSSGPAWGRSRPVTGGYWTVHRPPTRGPPGPCHPREDERAAGERRRRCQRGPETGPSGLIRSVSFVKCVSYQRRSVCQSLSSATKRGALFEESQVTLTGSHWEDERNDWISCDSVVVVCVAQIF